MKMIKTLDEEGAVLISNALNQMILQKLVTSQHSITELAQELNIPPLKIWRRMQRLTKAKLVEVSGIEKVGNLEKKLYRTTALRFDTLQQFFAPKLNNINLQAAFRIYVDIQKELMTTLSTFDNSIPKDDDPTDFAIYALMQAFVQVFEKTTTQANIQEIKKLLVHFGHENTPHKN